MGTLVLVADDDPDILQLLHDVLETEGYEVLDAVGAETVDVARHHRPEVVVLDYQMPGMDGIEVAQRLRADPNTQHIYLVAMTAMGRTSTVCEAMQADGCLGKPFNVVDLLAVVERTGHLSHGR